MSPTTLRRKLQFIREHKRAQFTALCQGYALELPSIKEWSIFEQDDLIETWIASIARIAELGLVVPDSVLAGWLPEMETVIFEGAQGILLDADAGFHPYTTWSRCTAENALDLIHEMAPGAQVFKIGVLRSYAVRHGAGPLPTETDDLTALVSEHNQRNEWQGRVRYGWFDAVLARYALSVSGKIDALAVTHLDMLSKLKSWKYCPGYKNPSAFDETLVSTERSGSVLTSFHIPQFLTLEQRAHFTQELLCATPLLQTCDPDDESVIREIEALLGQPVDIISHGPGAENVQIVNPLPI
jgi:adenylosuccinate synthase